MIAYWVIFLIPAVGVLLNSGERKHADMMPVFLFGVFVALMIGLRFQVGGDWGNYLRNLSLLHYYSLEDAYTITSDMGYATLSWYMDRLGWGIYGINLVCGAIFMAGLVAFSLRTPDPWVGILVAVPYLLVVVAMGYTRQAVALGFEFFALIALARSEYWKYYVYIILGALFHKTAIVLLLLGVFSGPNRFSFVRICFGLVISYFAVSAFMADYYDNLMKNYVDAQMNSSGALIRVMMNVLPAILFLGLYRKWEKEVRVEAHWLLFALAALACIPLLAVTSTAVDRMALYLAPLQIYVWSHLPIVIRASWLRGAIVLYSATVLFVWLNFATHARFWVPYQSIIFQ